MTSKLLLLVLAALPVIAVAAEPDRSRVWIKKPWQLRYMIFVSDLQVAKDRIRLSRKWNARNMHDGEALVYYEAPALFQTPISFYSSKGRSIAVTLLFFDQSGRVQSSALARDAWAAKHSVLDRLLLIDPVHPSRKPYRLAEWSQGIPGNDTFGPAVCAWDDAQRYVDGWAENDSAGGFGCREWTAQLYRWDQPYIDVTSYTSSGAFIGDFVGWSRFSDPAKPVIGLEGKTWLCLHECPAGEMPGEIKDIHAWAKKHKFPLPERPPKQPLYPDADYKDDLNEFSDD